MTHRPPCPPRRRPCAAPASATERTRLAAGARSHSGARATAFTLALALALLLAGCATPLPALQWVRLPAEPPQPVTPPTATPPTAGAVWQLMAPVSLPGHLDRDPLLVPQGRAGLQPLGGARWAEPLREAVSRLLRQDLARALGAEVWEAPLPPGLPPTRQLRIELLAFDIGADGRSVALQARWSVAEARSGAPPRVGRTSFVTPAAGPDADALATAHRQALATLARQVADDALR